MNENVLQFNAQEERTYALLGFILSRLSRIEAIHYSVESWENFSEAQRQDYRIRMPIMAAERDAESRTDTTQLKRIRDILAHGLYILLPEGGVSITDMNVLKKTMKKAAKPCSNITVDDTISVIKKTRVYTLSLDRLEELAKSLDEFTSYGELTEEAIEEMRSQPLPPIEEEKLRTWLSDLLSTAED